MKGWRKSRGREKARGATAKRDVFPGGARHAELSLGDAVALDPRLRLEADVDAGPAPAQRRG